MINQRTRVACGGSLFAAAVFVFTSAFASTVLAADEPPAPKPDVQIAYPEVSQPLMRGAALTVAQQQPMHAHPLGHNPFIGTGPNYGHDAALQTTVPFTSMPSTLVSFLGQGNTNGGIAGDPPDTNGAVGPNHYVQTVNSAYMIFNRSGGTVQASRALNTLWTGYAGTNAGNNCAHSNSGDPVVLYDQLADRWFITEFSLPNYPNGPFFQCVAVSQTPDPTGAYNLYDYQFSNMNDYGKFAVWPDGYYATFNEFAPPALNFADAAACAFDRVNMIAGNPAAEVCFTSASVFGYIPVSVDGKIPPPSGTPGMFLFLKTTGSLGLQRLTLNWATPSSSTFSTATTITISTFAYACGGTGGTCVVQPSPGNQLDTLGDRMMFRATYRNFGAVESLLATHTVAAGASTGVRWYEIRSPRTAPTVFQQGTYAPDTQFRWMGSIAQDMAQDMALGYSLSSSTTKPSIAWTGRTAVDTAGQMGQAEAIVVTGAGVETGTFSDGSLATRWGDYSAMTVDPTDDCTFWYTNEFYPANGIFNWETRILATKFANCAQNNFGLTVTPSSQSVAPGASVPFAVTSTSTGTAENITLTVQDLPSGVTGSFLVNPITAGTATTLTLTASAAAPLTASPVTFTVIGKATSAAHAATAAVSVATASTIPTNLVATATSSTSVGLTWTAVAGASSYKVFRKSTAADPFTTVVGTPATNAFTDTSANGVTANTAYLYKVESVVGGVASGDSNIDLATTVIFTDPTLVSGTTFIKALHLTEIRTALTAVATLAGTAPLTFTDPTLSSTVALKSVHITEARTMLNSARTALGLGTLTFANSAASSTVISGTDFQELRNGMQ